MKNLFLPLLFIVLFSVASSAQQAKKYAVKSGYLKLELAGSTVGTREIWWDDYGQKSYEYEKSTTTIKMLGIKSVEQKDALTVINDGKFWSVDYIENTAYTGPIPNLSDFLGLNDLTEEEREALAYELLEDMGGQRLGVEDLNGYSCELIMLLGIKVWVYKGVGLKAEGKLLGVETKEMFSEFKPETKVQASKFTPPADVQFKDITQAPEATGLATLVEALDESFDAEDAEEEKSVPVSYPFEKFKKILDGFSYPEYACRGIYTVDGMHVATYSKGISASLMIVASALQNADKEAEDGYEEFKHKGRSCYYSKLEDVDEEGAVLVVKYPDLDMFIGITAVPYKDKTTLLAISDKLGF